jgi:hypothetical protein
MLRVGNLVWLRHGKQGFVAGFLIGQTLQTITLDLKVTDSCGLCRSEQWVIASSGSRLAVQTVLKFFEFRDRGRLGRCELGFVADSDHGFASQSILPPLHISYLLQFQECQQRAITFAVTGQANPQIPIVVKFDNSLSFFAGEKWTITGPRAIDATLNILAISAGRRRLSEARRNQPNE